MSLRSESPAGLPVETSLHEPGLTGRYQILGEIDRGGMGAVLHGRDTDLNRDLAVKVLLDQHRDNPDVVRRFFEEAQIGGQLQHPGIVPVYDIGMLPDKRLFFAMKLVRGRTLAVMLKERRTTADGLPRFLSIFEQVAQTVAYAHSRGVIHRDLKPSNIMVGAFGEVQVMDWGLAKVLGSSGEESADLAISLVRTAKISTAEGDGSVAGSILGTPAYMAPEQARGETDRVDERADVFGLGSILCAILTGEPAYLGGTLAGVLRKAERADLADAFSRLDACGADRGLMEVAKAAMASEPEARPRDAGVVAASMTAHLAGVQERLRSSELARVEADTRASAERSRRKLVFALASTIGLSSLAGGVAWVTHRLRIEALIAKTDRIVGEPLVRAELLEAEARRLGNWDRGAWERALAAAEQARDRMSGRSVGPVLSERVAMAYAATSKGVVHARELAERREAARTLAGALDAARLEGALGRDGGLDAEATRVAYAEAFRDAGINVDAQTDSESARRLGLGEEPERIAAALDDWARLEPDPGRRSRLVALARSIDPDVFRNRVRTALAAPDLAGLVALARSPEVSTLPAASVRLMAKGLVDRGDQEDALTLLEAAQRRSPADFWINFDLGKVLQTSNPAEAVRYLTAAVTARPDSPGARVAVGAALNLHGKPDKAEVAFRDAIRLDPKYADAHSNLGVALDLQQKHEEGLAAHREAVRLDPEDADVQYNLGAALQGAAAFAEAASAYRQVLRLRPGDAQAATNLALALKRRGLVREAIRLEPKDEAQSLILASLCHARALYAAAAKFRGDALAVNPRLGDDRKAQHRYKAACSAALAGTGRGDDDPKPGDGAKAVLRKQAIGWLQEERDVWHKLRASGTDDDRATVAKTFEHWRTDPDLAGVRDPESLAKLPDDERARWVSFWESAR